MNGLTLFIHNGIFSSVQLLSRVRLFATPWTAACQASLFITKSQSPPKPMSIKSVMPSNGLILRHPLLLLSSIFPSIRVFPNESALRIRWPKYWKTSASASVLAMNTQGGFPLGLTSLSSLLSKGLSGVFSSIMIQRHQLFSAQPSSWSSLTVLEEYVKKFSDLSSVVILFPPKSTQSYSCRNTNAHTPEGLKGTEPLAGCALLLEVLHLFCLAVWGVNPCNLSLMCVTLEPLSSLVLRDPSWQKKGKKWRRSLKAVKKGLPVNSQETSRTASFILLSWLGAVQSYPWGRVPALSILCKDFPDYPLCFHQGEWGRFLTHLVYLGKRKHDRRSQNLIRNMLKQRFHF